MTGTWLVLFIGLWVLCVLLVVLVIGLSRRIQLVEARAFVDTAGDVRADATRQVREQFLGKLFAEQAVESGVAGAAGGMAGVVLFVSEGCGPCQALASDLSAKVGGSQKPGVAEMLGARVTVVTDQISVFGDVGATAVIRDPDGTVMNGFGVTATPTGIALSDDGVVVEALVANEFRDVEKLVQAIQPEQRAALLRVS